MKRYLLLLWCIGLPTGVYAGDVSYNRDVRPILSDKCFSCHGFDPKARKAGRRLDSFEGANAELKGVRAIVPGSAEKSEAWLRIISEDSGEVMPPPKTNKTLTALEKQIIKKWIEQGAKYEQHWSFVALAPVKVPEVKNSNWTRNPIDRFILARLEKESIAPSPEATRESLIRRLSLDLTGLPPTVAEVDAFVADTSEKAYEKVVDRLLKSPRYGERMAVDWLDAARFADSNGYQVDRDRELWPWRDWVIRAFNENKPFDQFTIEQLAGDLLPNASMDQKIATGFNRNHMLNEEGGVIADEFLAEYTADRVETMAAIWLGQTFNCARCHDHKYDPFTQRDFYSLKAFFNNIPERGIGAYGNPIRQNAPPFIKLPTPEIQAKINRLNDQVKEVNDQLAGLTSKATSGLNEWSGRIAQSGAEWKPLQVTSASGGDSPPKLDADSFTVEVGPQETRANTIKLGVRIPAGNWTALQFECGTRASSASVQWSEVKVVVPGVKGGKKSPAKLRAIASGNSVAATESAKLVDNDRKTRVAVSVVADRAMNAVLQMETLLAVSDTVDLEVELGVENANGPTRWRVLATGVNADLLVPAAVVAVAKKEETSRSAAEKKQLSDFRLSQLPEFRNLNDRLAELKKQLTAADNDTPTTLVMEEMKEPRPTFVLMRGAYDKPGEKVSAATPGVLPALGADQPRNRLGLARWLVSPGNPLTARVTVNRLWQQVFGVGLVRTSEDFGAQGESPFHPELLDWLAGEFISSGWNVKQLMKLMVTSATYRQQSRITPMLQERDPENRLLARGPRFRLQAEFVRDQALAVSGLLVDKIGGPSVKPYHPPGLYEQVTAGTGYNVYVPGKGDDLHRRSLYTYWKRSVPNPAMLVFDAPFRESCTLRRPRTNTPLQALNLMNDPTYVEASRMLAQRMMREGGQSVDTRIIFGFRSLVARSPKPAEMAILRSAYDRSRMDFEKDPASAKALLAVGEAKNDAALNPAELAAFTGLASTMLNLDEVITKE